MSEYTPLSRDFPSLNDGNVKIERKRDKSFIERNDNSNVQTSISNDFDPPISHFLFDFETKKIKEQQKLFN